jgi:hypothetical protein
MHWAKETLERFFGAKLTSFDAFHEMRFEAGGIRYRLCLLEHDSSLFLTGDVQNPDYSLPAIEIGFVCRHIEETEASNVGPVLLFYASPDKQYEHLRLCITRDPENRFSISPHWHQQEIPG